MLDRILATIPPVSVKDLKPATIALAFSAGVAQAHFKERQEVLARADKALHFRKSAREGIGSKSLAKRLAMMRARQAFDLVA